MELVLGEWVLELCLGLYAGRIKEIWQRFYRGWGYTYYPTRITKEEEMEILEEEAEDLEEELKDIKQRLTELKGQKK